MVRRLLIVLLFLTGVAAAGMAYGGQMMSAAGTVISVDPEGGVVEVRVQDGKMVFNIVTESDLYMSSHHMSAVEIERNDPVMVDYVISSSGKNNIIKLVDTRANS